MKKLTITVMLLASINCHAQFVGFTYTNIDSALFVASYVMKSQRDSTDKENIQNSNMLLFLGENSSKFINRAYYVGDTIIRRFTSPEQTKAFLTDPQSPKPGQRYQIYKQYTTGKQIYIDNILSDSYKFEEELNLFDWNICADTTTICGFKSQMATCEFGGRKWVAWFAPEIPFSDGPYKFNGLPGLIVKVYDTRDHYVFELTAFNRLDPLLVIDMENKSYINTTKQVFFKAQDAFRNDIVNRAKDAGLDNQSQQTAAKNMASRNNPIELKRE